MASSTGQRKVDHGLPPLAGEWYDHKAAQRVVDFFSHYLVHVQGEWAGQPLILEPWQERIVRIVFGWKRANGHRRFRRVWIEVPRKNGKSTMGAGIALYLLMADREPGAQIIGAADSRDQASLIFDIAAQMVYRSPVEEMREADVHASTKRIVITRTGSYYRAIPAEAPKAHGFNPHAVIVDEVHTQPDRRLYDALMTAQGARRQPMAWFFTTAGNDPISLYADLHDHARQVHDGVKSDPGLFPVIFAASEKDDWKSEATWKKANPSWDALGESFREDMRDRATEARLIPAFENEFKRTRLNIQTRQDVRWMPMDLWDASAGYLPKPEELEGRSCYAGLDLAQVDDLTALALVFSPDDLERGTYDVLMRFWLPEETVARYAYYEEWAREGWLSITPGNATDFGYVREEILELSKHYHILDLGYDRWAAYQLSQELQDQGINVRPMGQGYRSMNHPTKELLRIVKAKRLRHGGHPVLRWNADNLVVSTDPAANIKPNKAAAKGKIDGAVALIMAVDGATRQEQTFRGDGLVIIGGPKGA